VGIHFPVKKVTRSKQVSREERLSRIHALVKEKKERGGGGDSMPFRDQEGTIAGKPGIGVRGEN